MSNVLIYSPKHKLDYQKNYDEFVFFAKDKLTLFDEYEFNGKTGWKSDKWGWESGNKNRQIILGCSSGWLKYEPFKAPFSEFARAYARYKMSLKPVQSVNWYVAMKYLYLALEEKSLIKDCVDRVDLMDIDNSVVNRTNELIINKDINQSTKRNMCISLEQIVKFIIKKKFKLDLHQYKNVIKRPKDHTTGLDKESRNKQKDKCPSDFQMIQLAKAFRIAKTPKQKYYTSLAAVLMSQPSRGAELTSLTINSLQINENGKMYLMWHPVKGGDPIRKPVNKLLQDVTRNALERLDKISKPARKMVKFAYENPTKYQIPDECIPPKKISQNKELTYKQFACALGLRQFRSDRNERCSWLTTRNAWFEQLMNKINGVKNWRKILKKNQTIDQNNHIVDRYTKHKVCDIDIKLPSYQDLRECADKKYKKTGFPNMGDSQIRLWDCITLIRENEFHHNHKATFFSWTFPTTKSFNTAFGSYANNESIFNELGLADEDGSSLKITTHQPRHWLNTKLQMAGVDEWLIAKFSGRSDINQNKYYDGRTVEQKQRLMRLIGNVDGDNSANELTTKDVNTQLATYTSSNPPPPLVLHGLGLKVSLKSLGVQRDGVAQFTGLGFCAHNYAQSPCMKNSDCMSCKEHVCMKGLPNTIEEIESIEALISEQYEQALKNQGEQVFGADRWVSSLGFRLAKIRFILNFMKNPEVGDGAMVRIPDELDPSPVKRALSKNNNTNEIPTTIDLIELTKNNLGTA